MFGEVSVTLVFSNFLFLLRLPAVFLYHRSCCWRPNRTASLTVRLVRFWAPAREKPEGWGWIMASSPGSNRWDWWWLKEPADLRMTVISHLRSTHWQQSIQQWPTICTAPITGRYAAVTFRNHWWAQENVLTIFLILQEHDLDFNDRGIMVLGCGPYHIGSWASFYSSASSLHPKTIPL